MAILGYKQPTIDKPQLNRSIVISSIIYPKNLSSLSTPPVDKQIAAVSSHRGHESSGLSAAQTPEHYVRKTKPELDRPYFFPNSYCQIPVSWSPHPHLVQCWENLFDNFFRNSCVWHKIMRYVNKTSIVFRAKTRLISFWVWKSSRSYAILAYPWVKRNTAIDVARLTHKWLLPLKIIHTFLKITRKQTKQWWPLYLKMWCNFICRSGGGRQRRVTLTSRGECCHWVCQSRNNKVQGFDLCK